MLFSLLHSFINIFADGYSDIKTFLFFLYLLILGLLYILFKNKPLKKLNWLYFGATIITTYLYGLALLVFYSISNKIPLTKPFITGGSGDISYSSLWHTQILKGSIGIFFPNIINVDDGGAYLGHLPNWIFWISAILLILLLLQTIIYFTGSFRNYLKNKNLRQVIFLILGYALLSFSLIKTSIDGGIFHPAFGVGVIFILLFILRERKKLPKYYYYIIIAVDIILILINNYLNGLIFGSGFIYIQIATLLALYNLIFYCSVKKINIITTLLLIALFLTSWWLYSYRDLGIYKYSNFSLPVGQDIYFYDNKTEEVKTLQAEPNQTIGTLSKQLNQNINYLPIAIDGITCKESFSNTLVTFTVITPNPIARNSFDESSKYIKISSTDSIKSMKNWKTDIRIYKKSCVPEMFSVVNGLLKKNNINTYIYYNITGF